METLEKKVKTSEKHILAKQMKLFEWEVTKDEKIDEIHSKLTFVRDDLTEYYGELVKLEKEYFHTKKIPLWLLIVLAVIAVTLMSLFVVFGIAGVGDMPTNIAIFSFLLPGVVFVAIVGGLGIIFTNSTIANATTQVDPKRDTIYKEKVEGLKHGK